ncbi:MAG: HEAT repeat domain-containing protein [Planctomycetota bacterium]|nr:HEAT repeat domain-containing protein [Planctomycetota bacterium]
MILPLLLGLLSPAPLALHAAPAVHSVFVQDDEFPDKRADVKEWLSTLKGLIGKRGDEDPAAIVLIEKLTGEFKESGEKDRVAIAKGVAASLSQRRKELSKGVPDNGLKLAAAKALGSMGPESTSALSKWVDDKKVRDNIELQRQLVLSLGLTKDKGATKTLVDLLKYRNPTIIAAAAEALSQFQEFELKARKKLFEELLKTLQSAKGKVDADPTDNIARAEWNIVSAPLMTSLTVLSGHKEAKRPEEWTRFWNKNKNKKSWGDE